MNLHIRWRVTAVQMSCAALWTGVIAVAVGVTTLMVGLYTQVFLRTYVVAGPTRVVHFPGVPIGPGLRPNLERLVPLTPTVTSLASYLEGPVNVSWRGHAIEVHAAQVTPAFFTTLSIAPRLGRTPVIADGEQVVVASLELARLVRVSGTEPLGAGIDVNGRPMTIVGIVDDLHYPNGTALWMPFGTGSDTMLRDSAIFWGVAAVRPGVDLPQIVRGLTAAGLGDRPSVEWLGEQSRRRLRPVMLVLGAAVAVLIGLSLVSLAFLQLLHSLQERRGLQTRLALGASPGHLVRRAWLQSGLRTAAGSAAGLAAAHGTWKVLRTLVPPDLAIPDGPRLAAGAVGVSVAVLASAIAVLVGTYPVIRGGPLGEILQARGVAGDRSSARAAKLLTTCQTAASVVLVALACTLAVAVDRLLQVDRGFSPEAVLVADISLPHARYPSPESRREFFRQALERLGGTPGLEAASASSLPPFSSSGVSIVPVEHELAQPIGTVVRAVAPGSFVALGSSILQGRDFTWGDDWRSMPVAIASSGFAAAAFGTTPIVGRQLRWPGQITPVLVVGVAADVADGLDGPPLQTVYVPFFQRPRPAMSLLVRARLPPAQAARAIREVIGALDPQQPVARVELLSSAVARAASRERLAAIVTTVLALAAVIMAIAGTYGATAFSLDRRRDELAVRASLGAQPGSLLRLMLRDAGGPLVAGGAIGLAVFWGAAPLLLAVSQELTRHRTEIAGPVVLAYLAIHVVCVSGPLARAAFTPPVPPRR